MQEELSRAENRLTKLELQRMSAEGDLQRLQMMLQEKDDSVHVIIAKLVLSACSLNVFVFRNFKKNVRPKVVH